MDPATRIKRLIYSVPPGTRVLPARKAIASPLELLEQPRPLPPMRDLEVIGRELYPAAGLRVYQRPRQPGSLYPDEIAAIEEAMPSVRQDMEDGLAAGYGQWYFTGPLQDAFRSRLGQRAGDREFRRQMGLMSAASNQTPVEQEIKKGSLYYNLYHKGMLPATSNYEDAIQRVRRARDEGVWIPGYGHRNQATDMMKAGQFLESGRLRFPGDVGADVRHKVPDYFDQKIGGPDSAAMDSWMHRWFGLPFEARAYEAARQAVRQAADGVPISQAQPAIWMMRGARSPGMDSLGEPSFLHWIERRLKERANQLGEPPEKVMDDWIRGRQYLAKPQAWTEGQA